MIVLINLKNSKEMNNNKKNQMMNKNQKIKINKASLYYFFILNFKNKLLYLTLMIQVRKTSAFYADKQKIQ